MTPTSPSSSQVNQIIIAIINDPHTKPERVRNAFAALYKNGASTEIEEGVNALYRHHPHIAEEFAGVIPERMKPKSFEWAV